MSSGIRPHLAKDNGVLYQDVLVSTALDQSDLACWWQLAHRHLQQSYSNMNNINPETTSSTK